MNDHQLQRTKIGHFDAKIWKNIFQHLSGPNLANLATVCKGFQTLAQNRFKRRYEDNGEYIIAVPVDKIGWKPVLCRFKNIITGVQFSGQTITPYSKGVLHFIEEFLSRTLKRLDLLINAKHFENFEFHETFVNLERLTLFKVHVLDEFNVVTTLSQWCPNLKSLALLNSYIPSEYFFYQSLPSLDVLKLHNIIGITVGNLLNFLAGNNQLKDISIEGTQLNNSNDTMLWLNVFSESLIDLEKMSLETYNLDFLSRLRCNFAKLKSLSFLMANGTKCNGTYTNQLLRITKYLPKIECLRVINCEKNLMTNNDLIDLIDQSSSTLKQVDICSYSPERALNFEYDLHRQIYGTSNRSHLCVSFEFGDVFYDEENMKTFSITKDGIWENDDLIVIASTLSNP